MRSLRGHSAGFTLIELILVLTLVSVMASIIAPVLRITPSREVQNAAALLATHLELARTESLSERQLVRVDFDVAGGTATGFIDHDDNDAITGIAAETLAFPAFGTRSLPDLLEFGRGNATALPGDPGVGAVTLTSNQLLLSDQGLPEPWGTMGTIYITHQRDADAVAAVFVASSGSFRAWRWDSDAGAWR